MVLSPLPAQPPAAQTIPVKGTVQDAAGKPVPGAAVRLEGKAASSTMQATSNADGLFAFDGVAPGQYMIRAEKPGLGAAGKAIDVSPGLPAIILKLQAAAPANAGQQMEFSDVPNFTIAAVTDWTAAGGHGSDNILRASESLTRDTVNLKKGADSSTSSGMPDIEPNASLRAELAAHPASFEANAKMGAFYLRAGEYHAAIPHFEAACRARSGSPPCEYSRALTLLEKGEFLEAREPVRTLLAKQPDASLIRLDGELDEKLGDPLAAVKALEQAAREDPTEENYFQWGSELLLHRAIWQAKDVFAAGAKRYPRSARLLTALGSALFACALYEDAAQRLCEAADINPGSAEPYLFLGKVERSSPNSLECVEPKLAEFAQRNPKNPLASYYYAMAIWKQSGQSTDPQTLAQVETLLHKAIDLDPQCSDAYLELGMVSSARHQDAQAIDYYSRAIAANPQLLEAYYRLAVAYDRVGEREKAKREFELHEQLEKKQKALVEEQRREVKQFLVVQGKPAEATKP